MPFMSFLFPEIAEKVQSYLQRQELAAYAGEALRDILRSPKCF